MRRAPLPPVTVPETADVRKFWLNHADVTPSPIVGASTTVPRNLVPFLVRSKKTSSFARKYVRGDKISNLEAAWHTLVVPVVFPVWLSGVYAYENRRHVMHRLPGTRPHTAVLSALIQPDFELKTVMYDIIRLDRNRPLVGKALDDAWVPPAPDKISPETELELKQHFIFHFAKSKQLPAARDIPADELQRGSIYLQVGNDVLSLELLRNCLREQMRVEFATLVDAVKDYGLKLEYTWDPPVIFARTLNPELLDELWLDAVSSPGIVPPEVVTIAFNDFRNKTIIPRLRNTLHGAVTVCSKADLSSEPESEGLIRVLHNNSDAFGQHILTSPCAASLDGAIGSCSSAAASLCKPDVQRFVYVRPTPLEHGQMH